MIVVEQNEDPAYAEFELVDSVQLHHVAGLVLKGSAKLQVCC